MKTAITFFLLAWFLPASAAVHRIDCPAEIKRDTIQIIRAPDGWTAFYPFAFQPGLPLNAAGVMLGPPSSMTMSKPTWIGVVKGRDAERWSKLAEGEKWMACFYGDHGQHDAILSKPIDADATECTVTYPSKKRSEPIQIICTDDAG